MLKLDPLTINKVKKKTKNSYI